MGGLFKITLSPISEKARPGAPFWSHFGSILVALGQLWRLPGRPGLIFDVPKRRAEKGRAPEAPSNIRAGPKAPPTGTISKE